MFQTLFYTPLLTALVFFYHLLGNSFGLAVIVLTVLLRLLLAPLTIPSMKSQQKMMELGPQLSELKKRYKDKDKTELQKAQLELYRRHGVNPGSGCLLQIVQIVFLIALYQVFMNFLNGGMIDGAAVNMNFLWLNLSAPDRLYILPVLAGATQLIYSLMLRPGTEHPHEAVRSAEEKKEEKDEMSMAQEIQNQMLFLMPIMTVVISLRFPSGLALYWVVTTVASIVQQWLVTGPGGLRYARAMIREKLEFRKNLIGKGKL